VSQQTFDRKMRLAGIGGAQHGLHPRGESGHDLIVVHPGRFASTILERFGGIA
jgi:F420-0:gamma-glutamyl ligase-like protein